MTAKRLEFLRALVPDATQIAVLVDPTAPVTETTVREVEAGAGAMGLRIRLLKARTSAEIDAAFASLARERPDALFVAGGFLFSTRRSSWPTWRRAMRCPPSIPTASMLKPVG